MASNPQGSPELVTPPARLPEIVIRFEGEGLAGFTATAPGVSPAQLYGAAFYLAELGRATFAGELRRQASLGLVAPPPGFDPGAKRS